MWGEHRKRFQTFPWFEEKWLGYLTDYFWTGTDFHFLLRVLLAIDRLGEMNRSLVEVRNEEALFTLHGFFSHLQHRCFCLIFFLLSYHLRSMVVFILVKLLCRTSNSSNYLNFHTGKNLYVLEIRLTHHGRIKFAALGFRHPAYNLLIR